MREVTNLVSAIFMLRRWYHWRPSVKSSLC